MGGLSKLPYCTGRWGVIFFAYFGEISRFAYDDLPDGKQLAVLEAHRHKRECSLCRCQPNAGGGALLLWQRIQKMMPSLKIC